MRRCPSVRGLSSSPDQTAVSPAMIVGPWDWLRNCAVVCHLHLNMRAERPPEAAVQTSRISSGVTDIRPPYQAV